MAAHLHFRPAGRAGSRIPGISVRLLLSAVLVVLAGCATSSFQSGKGLEDQVKDRATKRWQALIKGDLDRAYEFFSSATKGTYPIELYRVKMRPGMWRNAEVESVSCTEQVCDVTVVLTIDHAKVKGIVSRVVERWILQDGQAWYVYNG